MRQLVPWNTEIPLVQAALRVVGKDLATITEEEMSDHYEIPGYAAAFAILCSGLTDGTIKGTIVYQVEFKNQIDEMNSTIKAGSLEDYLESWEYSNGYSLWHHLVNRKPPQDYLDPHHPRYAPKLAAAVYAWFGVGNKSESSPRTPKQLLEEWLLKHAADFDLSDNQGKANRQGIEDVAKVANWKPTGGAPKTISKRRRT